MLSAVSCSLGAQSPLYSIRHFSEDDGLFGRNVRTVAQDSTGLIWIGTSEGIYTFDGEEFRNWEDTSALASHLNIQSFTAASTGGFYLQTIQGKTARFNPYQRTITPILLKNSVQDVGSYQPLLHQKNAKINFLYDDIKGVYTQRESGIKKITGLRDSTLKVLHELTPWGTLLRNNREAKQLSEFDVTGRRIRKLDYSFIKEAVVTFLTPGLSQQRVAFTSYHKSFDELYEYNEEGLISKFEYLGEGAEKLSLLQERKSPNSLCIVQDSSRNYWIAKNNTLLVLDKNKNLIKDLSPQLKRLNDKSWAASELFVDNQQRIWLSTAYGLFLISPKSNPFTLYLKEEINPSLRGIIKVSETELLVGTYLSPRVINLITGKDRVLKNEDYFLGITRGPDGKYYGGHHGPSVSVLDTPLVESLIPHSVGTKMPDLANLIVPYYDDRTGIMFCGTPQGLYVRDSSGLFTTYSGPGEDYFRTSKMIEFFRPDAQGLLFCADNGIYRFSPERGVEEVFSYKNIRFKHFHISRDGIYWIATKGGGLVRWNPITNETKQYTKKNGLSDNVLYAVYEDDSGRLWLPSNQGLMLFNPKTESIRVFTTEDGIAHNEFNTFSHFKDEDGRIYLGGIDGLTAFYPSDIKKEETNYPLRLTVLNQFNGSKNAIEDALPGFRQSQKLVLQPSDKFFSVTFALQDYSSNNTKYAWKLAPSDQEWTYQSDNSIRINGLSYGNHLLTIRGRGQGKDWNKKLLEIPIFVTRPFYQRGYVQLVFALFLGLMIYTYIHQRTTRLIQEKHKLRRMVDERTEELVRKNQELQDANKFKDRLFALISHDLRAPVISLRGLTRKVRYLVDHKRFKEIDQLAETIDGAVSNTQNLLDNLLAWAIGQAHDFPYHPESVDLREVLENNDQVFQSVAKQKNITLKTNTSESVNAYADATAVATIIRNLTDNAIKFTPSQGAVGIEAKTNKMMAIITVSDQGTGIPPGKVEKLFTLGHPDEGTNGEKGVGLGLPLSKELAIANQGQLTLTRNGADGATFTLSLPLKDTLKPD